MQASPAAGITWALTPARPPQVFGTSPKEHEEAIERVKKAKVRLLLAWAELTSHSAVCRESGWRRPRKGLYHVHTEPLEAPLHPSAPRPPPMP